MPGGQTSTLLMSNILFSWPDRTFLYSVIYIGSKSYVVFRLPNRSYIFHCNSQEKALLTNNVIYVAGV
jgi:hypothetical protein